MSGTESDNSHARIYRVTGTISLRDLPDLAEVCRHIEETGRADTYLETARFQKVDPSRITFVVTVLSYDLDSARRETDEAAYRWVAAAIKTPEDCAIEIDEPELLRRS